MSERKPRVAGETRARRSARIAWVTLALLALTLLVAAPAAANHTTSVPFSDNLENGAGAWTATGFWNLVTNPENVSVLHAGANTPECPANDITPDLVTLPDAVNGQASLPPAHSVVNAWWYGVAAHGTFIGPDLASVNLAGQTCKNGGVSTVANSGTLTTGPISLAGLNSATLRFWTWFEIESVDAQAFDLMTVQISTNGSDFVDLGRLNPGADVNGMPDQPFTSGGCAPCPPNGYTPLAPTWVESTFSLNAYVGQNVWIRFAFNTGDANYNGFRGWLIDDVQVDGTVNDPPVALNDGPYNVVAGDTLLVPVPGVLGNDSDADGPSPLTAVLGTGPQHAAFFTLNANGSFSYTPAANFLGTDSFTYRASDGQAQSGLATVTINVIPPTGAISGQVKDANSVGIVGATVFSNPEFAGGTFTSVFTGPGGVYTLSGLVVGSYRVSAQADTYATQWYNGKPVHHLSDHVLVARDQTTTGIDFTLASGAGSISGCVTDSGSNPLQNIPVNIHLATGGYVMTRNTGPGACPNYTTGLRLAPGFYKAQVSTNGYAQQLYNGASSFNAATSIQVTAGSDHGGVNFTLSNQAGGIKGTVTLAGGGALGGIQIDILEAATNNGVAGAMTAADGTYSTSLTLPPGSYKVRARGPNVAQQTLGPFTVVNGVETTADFVLSPGGTITGTLRRASDSLPLGGVAIDVFDAATNAFVDGSFITFGDGTYTTNGLATGTYKVRARAVGYATAFSNGAQTFNLAAFVSVTVGTSTTADFSLAVGRSITGTVTGSGPVAGALIDVFTSANQFVEGSFVSDANGAYSTEGRLAGGVSYKVQARLAGHATQVWNGQRGLNTGTLVPVAGTDVGGIDFSLVQGGGFRGTVKDTANNPIAGAVVDLFDAATPNTFLIGGFVTGADGTYDTGLVLIGNYKVKARVNAPLSFVDTFYNGAADGSGMDFVTATPVTAVAGDNVSNLNIAMPPGGRISGTILIRNTATPIPNASVFVGRVTSNNFFGTFSTRTDANGNFQIRGLRDGEWTVRAEAAGYMLAYFSGDPNAPVPGSGATLPIMISGTSSFPGANINLLFGGVSISGQVTRSTGGPVPAGTPIQALIGLGGIFPRANFVTQTSTDASGNYTISGLSPGVLYLVQALGNQTANGTAMGWYPTAGTSPASAFPVDVSGGSVSGVNFTVLGFTGGATPRTISGIVKDSQGNPIRFGTVVALEPFFQFGVRGTGINGDGTYTIPNLPPGRYLVRATTETTFETRIWNDQLFAAAGATVDVTASDQTGINFALPATAGTIRGLVRALSDPNNPNSPLVPVAGVLVGLRNFFDNSVTSAITRRDGTYLLRGLPAGDYKLRMANAPEFAVRFHTTTGSGSAIFEDGSFVHVSPGQNVTDIDVVLTPSTGRIVGTVVAQGTLAPVIGGAVSIREATTGGIVAVAVTRADGQFNADNLAPGNYKLRVTAPGYATQWWSGRDTLDQADVITVTTGDVTNRNFTMVPTEAAFSGRVFKSDGSPLAGAGIVVFDAATFALDAQGRAIGFVRGAGVTDSQGRFVADLLKPGMYIAQTRALAYARTFFGQVPDAGAAALFPIAVTSPPDPSAVSANFTLPLTSDITGTISYAGAQTGALRVGLFCDGTLSRQAYSLVIPSPVFPQAYQFSLPAPDTRGLLPSAPTCPTTGAYFVGAFIDANGNGADDATEPTARLGGGTPTALTLAEGTTLSGNNLTLSEGLVAAGTTTSALGVFDIVVPSDLTGSLEVTGALGDLEIQEIGAPALSAAGRIELTLPQGLTFAALPHVSMGVSFGLSIIQTGADAPRLELGDRRFSFTLSGPPPQFRGGPASIFVSSMLIRVPAGFAASNPLPFPVGVTVGSSVPNGLTGQQVQNGRLIAPPPGPVFTGIALDTNAAGLGATREVVLNGYFFDQLKFTNCTVGVDCDTIDFGPGITVVGTPSVSADGTQITVTIQVAPGATLGNRTVTIINNPGGQVITATLPGGDTFKVDALPAVTGAGTGETHTGSVFADLKKQTVYIMGSNFLAPTTSPPNLTIQFSGAGITVDPTSIVFQSSTLLSVEVDVAAGADAVSPRAVMVTNPDFGTTTSGLVLAVAPPQPDQPIGLPAPKTSGGSTPVTPPSLTSINPSAAATGASVTITGTGFGSTTTTTVTFATPNGGKTTVAPTSVTGSTSLSVVVPANTVDGLVSVTVGTLASSNSLNFTVTNPRPSGATPTSAFQGDTATLDITGAKFQSGMTVALSPADANTTVGTPIFVDSTRVQVPVTLKANAATGLRDLVLTNPNNGGTGTLTNAFQVNLKTATTMTLALKSLGGTTLDASTWLPSVEGVQVTLDATGKCTAKTVTPTSIIIEAQVAGSTPPPTLTFTIAPSAIWGTATNEDCEIDPTTLAVIPAAGTPTNDFTIGREADTPSLIAPLSVTVDVVNGVARAKLSSWDWGGKVRITVTDSATPPTVAGTLNLPLDTDGDDLPNVYENNLLAGVDNTDANGVNVLDATKRDQNANGVSDRDDRFARDGLSNFEKYRGVYLQGPLNGTTAAMTNLVRLGAGKRNLFVRGRGFSTDPAIAGRPGTCGVDNNGNPVTPDAAFLATFPCPAFQVGDAFRAIGVQVWDVAGSFTGTSVLPTKSYADPTKPTLDMATVTYDAVNCSGGQACDHTGKTGIRQWQFPTLGFSTFGSSTTNGDARVFARAVKAYFMDKPYKHQENVSGKFIAANGGTPVLAPITIVCDNVSTGSDNGTAETGECTDPNGKLGGDVFDPTFTTVTDTSAYVSAMDVNNDNCVELPFVADPTTLQPCNPTASSAPGVQATFQQVTRSIITHELGHATGVNIHTTDSTDLMYQYSINWTRDGHFSPSAASLVQIHNKGLQ